MFFAMYKYVNMNIMTIYAYHTTSVTYGGDYMILKDNII